ncbi:MAG: NAD(P)H-binding protein, partial [Actinomycetota bacterium]|nr:NAD(P)H-binding protein [Actinomycetota bacterium]
MRVLVSGATGFIGTALVPALIGEGHDVVAGTRHPDRYRVEGGGGGGGRVTAVRFDVGDPSSLDAALEGADAAYYLVHGMAGSGDFVARDRRAAEAFAAAASRRGVRVVYLGGLGDREVSAGRSAHLRSRHEVG